MMMGRGRGRGRGRGFNFNFNQSPPSDVWWVRMPMECVEVSSPGSPQTGIHTYEGDSRLTIIPHKWYTMLRLHAKRFGAAEIGTVAVTDYEVAVLSDLHTNPLTIQYLCWRRSIVTLSIPALVVSLALQLILWNVGQGEEPRIEAMEWVRETQTAARLRSMLLTFRILAVVFQFTTTVIYAWSAWSWQDFSSSRTRLQVGWALSYCLGFVQFYIPWAMYLQPDEFLREACHSLVQQFLPLHVGECDKGTLQDLPNRLAAASSGPVEAIKQVCAVHPQPTSCHASLAGMETQSTALLQALGLALTQAQVVFYVWLVGRAAQTLMPVVIGTMFGMMRGLRVVKTLCPTVRLTGWMLVAGTALVLPLAATFSVLLVALLGNIPAAIGAVFVTGFIGVYLPFPARLIDPPINEEQLANPGRELALRQRIASIVLFLGGGLLVLSVLLAPQYGQFLDAITQDLPSMLINALRGGGRTLGLTFVSKVIFGDIAVGVLRSVEVEPLSDPPDVIIARRTTLEQLMVLYDRRVRSRLRPNKVTQMVTNADESPHVTTDTCGPEL